MSNVLFCIVIVIAVWYEWELVKSSIAPLFDAVICLCFSVWFVLIAAIMVCLVVICPIALFFGRESRNWPNRVIRKMTFTMRK